MILVSPNSLPNSFFSFVGDFVRIPYCSDHCLFFTKSALLVGKECFLTSFIGDFVNKVSYEADYEVIEFLIVGIKVHLALECCTIGWEGSPTLWLLFWPIA